ncbi:MAG: ABC transporter ATP-binding protein, partial [Clostridiales bacterium]
SKTGRLVMDLFHKLNREQGKTVILITHNQQLAAETNRMLLMHDGMLYANIAAAKEGVPIWA